MPISAAGVGAIISGVGSLAQGFGGGSSGGPSSNKRREAYHREDTAIQRRVADARAAGVHPLYALGANVQSSGGGFRTLGSSGKDAGRAIKGVGAAISGYARGKTTPEEAARIELMGKQGAHYDALTAKALSDIARGNQPGLQLAAPGFQEGATGEMLPVEGGIMPKRTYRSPWAGNLDFKKGSPTAQQREDEAGEVFGNVDSFVSYLNAIGRKLGIMGSRRQELARRRVGSRLRMSKPYYGKRRRY